MILELFHITVYAICFKVRSLGTLQRTLVEGPPVAIVFFVVGNCPPSRNVIHHASPARE